MPTSSSSLPTVSISTSSSSSSSTRFVPMSPSSRHNQTTSQAPLLSSSSSSLSAHSASALTIEAALAPHVSSPNPLKSTLEAVLAERNSLSSQNSQLWRLIEKQRASYSQLMSEVQRIRGERDSWKAKAGGPRPEQEKDRDMGSTSRSTSNLKATARQQTDDQGSLRRAEAQALSKSRSQEPLRPPVERQNSVPVSTQQQPRAQAATVPNPSRSGSHPTPQARSSSPAPHTIPPRSDSLQLVDSHSTNTQAPLVPPLNIANKQSSATGSAPIVTFTLPTNPKFSGSALAPAPAPATGSDYRVSRISLPDEAKRYIASMNESPLPSPGPSPNPDVVSMNTIQSPSTPLADSQVEAVGVSDTDNFRPMMDLEDDFGELDGPTIVSRRDSPDVDPARDATRTELPQQGLSQPSSATTARDGSHGSHRNTPDSGVEAQDYPKDSSGHSGPNAQMNEPLHRLNTSVSSMPSATSPNLSANSNGAPSAVSPHSSATMLGMPTDSASLFSYASTNTYNSENNSSVTLPPGLHSSFINQASASCPSETAPAYEEERYRQMPLLDIDLRNTSVQVVGSHIRANDKGKEVLSFVISVNIARKDGWVVEKFYSDVLALDNRLRQQSSRSIARKIPSLPDSKLFKDHAPAKVDQRKQQLQAYLSAVLSFPVKDKNEIVVFFSSDVMRQRSPVTQSGYKEGYLTKRGKNFGGWKTRYFVLQGPVLEYYESRGGNHLGSIIITGAQIGRQQKQPGSHDADDENEYRHAFLIIEAKRGPAGQHPRHVLCAESDIERDNWVDVLVRYVSGAYNEESVASLSQISTLSSQNQTPSKLYPVTLQSETAASSPSRSYAPSPVDRPAGMPDLRSSAKGKESPAASLEALVSSSLPTASGVEGGGILATVGQRANSELGHYPDLQEYQGQPVRSSSDQARRQKRTSFHPSLQTVKSSPTVTERPISPKTAVPPMTPSSSTPRTAETNRQIKISGPMNGTPIPAGYKFGARDPPLEPVTASPNDRERKAKSRSFWNFGRPADKSQQSTLNPMSRGVFGVSLQDSLNVAQIAGLPAVVFRCIQYLEAKKAELEEGIYRLSGSNNVIKSLKDRYNMEGDADLMNSDDFWDPHAIAGLLKSFFRELPTSILTHDLHLKFLAVMDFVDNSERIKELAELISRLPVENYTILRALTAHLILIVQNSNVNKMTMRNVGIVFSPTLGIPAGVFSLMLGEFNKVFNVDGEGTDSPADDTPELAEQRRLSSGLSRRNSRQYSDAAADQLLGLSGRSLPTTEENPSDEDISINEESGTETTTDADVETIRTIASSNDSTRDDSQSLYAPTHSSSSTDTTPKNARIANVAASRGLNLSVSTNGEAVNKRHSRMIGLPASPRALRSAGNTPTSFNNMVESLQVPSQSRQI